MTIINRRALMGGIAALPAVAVREAVAIPETTAAAYRDAFSAEDRLRHHLAMARQAMDELVSEPGSRWWITAAGTAGNGTASYRAHRFDLMPDPEIRGLMIESMGDVSEGRL